MSLGGCWGWLFGLFVKRQSVRLAVVVVGHGGCLFGGCIGKSKVQPPTQSVTVLVQSWMPDGVAGGAYK